MLWNDRGIYSSKNMKHSERKKLYSGVADVSHCCPFFCMQRIITRMGFHLCFHYAFFNNLSTPPTDYLIKLVTSLLHSFWNKQEKTKLERITHTQVLNK